MPRLAPRPVNIATSSSDNSIQEPFHLLFISLTLVHYNGWSTRASGHASSRHQEHGDFGDTSVSVYAWECALLTVDRVGVKAMVEKVVVCLTGIRLTCDRMVGEDGQRF
jgi:hypothetical protein